MCRGCVVCAVPFLYPRLVLSYKPMRRLSVLIIVLLVALTQVFSVSVNSTRETYSFDSIPMLEKWYDESDDGSMDFWDRCTVSLLTVSPGDPIYSWFGHSALMVTTPEGRNIAFDYGTFSFSDDDFIKNFVMGRLWFLSNSFPADMEMMSLEAEGRSVTMVVLPLSAQQKKAVIGFLGINVQSENRTYLYHHYNDNCATRLRDIIDFTTGGDFKRWAQEQDGLSFRMQASRSLSRNSLVQWVLEFLQSGMIDGSATLWDEMFLPVNLEKAVIEYYGLDRTLVAGDGENDVPDNPRSNILFSVVMGLVLCVVPALMLFPGKGRNTAWYITTGVIYVVFALLGSLLFFMMTFTNHDVTWMNENILFVNPLLIVLAILAFRRSPKFTLLSRIYLSVILLYSIVKLVIPGVLVQANIPVIIVMALTAIPGAIGPRRQH